MKDSLKTPSTATCILIIKNGFASFSEEKEKDTNTIEKRNTDSWGEE
jgi:hypothetical protein